MSLRNTIYAAVIAVLTAASAYPVKPGPMPPLPALSGIDGRAPFAPQSLPVDRRWLLVYLRPDCRPCETVLQMARREARLPALAGRLMIVVGGANATQLRKLRERFPELASARWYSATARDMRSTLKLAGSPVVVGVERRILRWSINGVPKNPELLRRAIVSWAGR